MAGLVTRQHSSGGKTVLLGINKRGYCYLRTLLIRGARSAVRTVESRKDPRFVDHPPRPSTDHQAGRI
jgi:transposase